MKIRKMIAATLAAAAMLTCASGCGKSGQSDPSGAESESLDSDPTADHTNDPMNITSASELVAQMKIGWNLGNTLDATGGEGVGAETSWGNPVTTKAMIDTVKEAGFNVLRVPVSWGTHVDDDMNIDPAWLDRVQEVVNYGIDNDMFVILNTHHEEWYMPRKSSAEKNIAQLEKLWTQIAERFGGYSEKLIFEGVNEPRLRGTGNEWTGTPDAREVVNRYAEAFVRTVRGTGGNNESRALMVTPYAASSMSSNLKAFKIPENSGNIIVSVHAYLPYDFALNTEGTRVYDKNDGSIGTLMKDIKSIFLDKGIPVIIGEFGSVNKINSEDRISCLTDFLNAANGIGVPCIWWDNGSRSKGEAFGLLNRSVGIWYFPEIMEALKELIGE